MKTFDAGKNRMIGLLYGEKKTMTMLPVSRFHLIPEPAERHGQTDGQKDRIAIYQYRASVYRRAIKMSAI